VFRTAGVAATPFSRQINLCRALSRPEIDKSAQKSGGRKVFCRWLDVAIAEEEEEEEEEEGAAMASRTD